MQTETITLAGGCFWCLEAVFLRVRGVVSVESGYSNGHVERPSYEQVCEGTTGHAEVVRLVFDPAQIRLQDLLAIFFAIHDPTTPDRQGNDVGPQYRSGIYAASVEQLESVRAWVSARQAEGAWPVPIVTEITLANNYWPAEPYHQNYFAQHPHQGYCAYVVAPKVRHFAQAFGDFVRRDAAA